MSINFVKKSLSLKLVLFILLGTGSILIGVGWYGYFCSRSILRDELIARVDGVGELVSDRVDRITLVVETVARDVGLSLFTFGRSSESLFPLLESVVMAHEEVAGLCAAFLPQKEEATFVPLVYKDGGGLHSKDFSESGTDFSSASWYRIPIESRSPFWTEPYFGYGGSERFVITYSVPSFDSDGHLIAVVACDLSLDWLADVMGSLEIPGGGRGFIVGSDGVLLSHENIDFLNRESLLSMGLRTGNEGFAELEKHMIKGERGIVAVEDREDDGWIVYRPIGDMGWSLGLFFPKTAVTGHLNNLLFFQIALASVGMILLLFVAWAISRAITGPIRALSCATERMSSGDFDFPLPHTSGEDEVAQLARSFSSMRESLIAHIERLKETTAARERMESELSIARSIQMSLVPRTFPPFPEKDGLDLFAVLDPAREVSGDFYDFLMLDDDNILITVGDVSGKGLPAALFMAVTRTFIRAFAKEGLGPGSILSKLNDEIARDNDSCMFVTVFCASISFKDGAIRYASGGHPPPLLFKGGSVRTLPPVKGPLIGPMPGMVFQEGLGRLEAGETILVYSDGMTEAMDLSGSFLGLDRPSAWLRDMEGLSCERTINKVLEGLRTFVGEAPQSDDITLLGLRVDDLT